MERKELLIKNKPESWPYKPSDFKRRDESEDSVFYSSPRFVNHIDDEAIAALSSYYDSVIPKGSSILDICSSWVSHIPQSLQPQKLVGVGLNEEELKANKMLTEWKVQDLNKNPILPFGDNLFQFVTCVVSVDYLNKPREIFKEMCRVLQPNGTAIMSFSNRCFPTKVISMWLHTSDEEHVDIVSNYFHFTPGFTKIQAFDISPSTKSDPLYIVQATKDE